MLETTLSDSGRVYVTTYAYQSVVTVRQCVRKKERMIIIVMWRCIRKNPCLYSTLMLVWYTD